MKQLLPLLFLFVSLFSNAQGIKGAISDSQNQPIAYANIYVPELKTGTTSNINGEFELKLPQGEWEVLFQYLGYQTLTQKFTIKDELKTLQITLQEQDIKLKEIKVLASGEDPAYYVMRHAIAMAPYYSSQVAEYHCKLYLKGTGVVYKIPRLFKKKMEKQGIEKDKPFTMESINKIHFELPDKLDQHVIAMRSTGEDRNTSPMQMITTNLYNVSDYGIASPVARNALKVYRFKLVGVFEDQGKLINKIEVTPKAAGQGAFSGILNIVDGYWNIHSADLKFSMPMMDVQMRQLYSLVEENTWMPTSLNFEMDLSALGFGLKYNYVASLSDYEVTLNDQLDQRLFLKLEKEELAEKEILDSIKQANSVAKVVETPPSKNQEKINELLSKDDLSTREMYKLERLMDKETKRTLPPEPLEIPERVKVNDEAIKNDSSYWAELRPIPLTEKEALEFGKKDSIVEVRQTPEYQDSVRDVRMKFKVKDILAGRTYRYGADTLAHQSQLSVSGLINLMGLSGNTVDGWRYSLPFSFHLQDTLGHALNINSSATYAFSRKTMYGDLRFRYRFNGVKNQFAGFSTGRQLDDFKGSKGISSMENDIYVFFFEENFQKFQEKKFVQLFAGSELVNGLHLKANFEYAKRIPVSNHATNLGIDYDDKEYTPNIPVIGNRQSVPVFTTNASKASVELTYTPQQRYRIRNHVRYPAGSDYPTFYLQYEKGISELLKSDVDYDLLKLGLSQQVKVGFDNYFNYSATAGSYLNKQSLFVQDYTFVNSNNKWLTLSNLDNQFFLPDYYQLYSADRYLEAHASFDLSNFILKKLPLLKGTLIREKLKLNYFTSESTKNYLEIGYGLSDIFLLFDVEFHLGFSDWNDQQMGFRISMNLQ